jgi:phospho-N-acetylmuramoyl-pentapeptide-transferase
MPKFIAWALKKKFNQPIYGLVDKHSQNENKKNVPTMGGVVFIFSTIVASLLTVHLLNFYVVGGLVTLILFGYIGFKDDIRKIVGKRNSAGLSAKEKLLLQIVFALIVSGYVILIGFPTELYVPFYKTPVWDMGLFAIPFFTLVMISSSNGVNLTDGLDGLATVPSAFAIGTLGVFAYLIGNVVLSNYLLLPNIDGVGEIVVIASALIGALIGFLWYNSHPAEVFMGDSGSLSVGAFIGYMAIVTKNEILLLLIGSIFVIESMSVLMQVASYKTRKKRVFLMAPIHHHFEMKNWHENKIIIRFWIVALLSNLIALISIKVR